MADAVSSLLHLLLEALGAVPTIDTNMLGLAVAIVAMAVLTLSLVRPFCADARGSRPHPLRAIDVSVLLSQSDPDAAGHPRPRAPGVAKAA